MARGLRDEAAGQAGAAAPDGAEPRVDLDFKRAAGVDGVDCVRPTPGYVEDGRGVWRLVPPDTPRVSDCGLLVEEARTNWIRNNAMAGATEGTPGDLPTHWRVTLPEGCAGRVVETGTLDGIDYVDIGVAGEARGGAFAVAFEAAGAIPAGAAQGWTCSAFFQVVSDHGDARLTAPRLAVSALTATGNEIEAATVNLAPERFERAHVVMPETPVGTTSLVPHLAAAQDWSGAVDFVVRIGWPQLELGTCPTSPIRTAGAKATRDADHIVAEIAVAAPCTIVAEFTAAFATSMPQSERRVVWSLSDGRGRACALSAGDVSAEGHPSLAIVDEHGRGIARSVRGFEAGTLLRVGVTLSSDVIESGCVALNGTPNSLLKGWLGEADAALTLGRDGDGRGTLCGTLRRLTIYPRALGISELMALTRPLRGESASRGARAPAQSGVRRPPEPRAPVPSAPPPRDEPESGREPGGALAVARRLFAFRRRATDQDPEAPAPVPAQAAAAAHDPDPAGAAPDRAPNPAPDTALLAARQQVAELEARLAAEQARAEALEQAHREEHARFATQIATLEATFHGGRADEATQRWSAVEPAEPDGRLRSLEQRQAELEAELEAARRRASEAQMQAAVEQAARTRLAAEQARLERQVATLQAGVEETRALAAGSARVARDEAARAAAVEAALRQELETARRHASELEAALSAEQALWAEHQRSAGEERAALEGRIANLDSRVEEAVARVSAMTERLADAEARRAELAQALEEAQERSAALEARCAELGAALEQRSDPSDRHKAEIAADLQAREDEREALRVHVEELQGRLEEASSRAAADAGRVAALDEAHAALAERLDQARLERVELAERVEAGEAQRAELERAHAEAREAFARQLEALQLRVTEALSQAAAAAADLVAAQEQRAALAASLDEVRRRASEAEGDARAESAVTPDLEGERGDDRGAGTEELARLRTQLETLLAASAQEAGATVPPTRERGDGPAEQTGEASGSAEGSRPVDEAAGARGRS